MGDFQNATLDEVAFAVIGVEGAALGATADAVHEVACVKVRNGREIQAFSSFADLGRDTAAGAAAGHELTGERLPGIPRSRPSVRRWTRSAAMRLSSATTPPPT